MTAKLSSGFGNRLFQIAAAASYAQCHDRKLVFVDRFIDVSVHDVNAMRYMKHILEIPTVRVTEDPVMIVETQLGKDYDANLVVLDGYFQVPTYVMALKPYFQRFLDSMPKESLGTTFVHVRLGDYDHSLFNAMYLNLENYYLKAMKGPGPYEIISNEPEKAEKRLKLSNVFYSVLPLMNMAKTFERFIMSSHAIIANSTFSYWGATLMKWRDPDATIIMPSPWNRLNFVMKSVSYVCPRITPNRLATSESLQYDTYSGLNTGEILTISLVIGFIVLMIMQPWRHKVRMHSVRT